MQVGGLSRKLTGAALAIALCASSTVAAAAAAPPIQSVSPLTVISVYGTQASAQAVCGTAATVAAGVAAAAQAPGCVLPARDAPPPVSEAPLPPPPVQPTGDFGINWVLAGLGALILIGAILAATNDADDRGPISPA